MIRMIDIHRAHSGATGRVPVLNGVTLEFTARERIGVIGAGHTGKSTLIRLLAGIELPDRGMIERNARLSWPLGTSLGVHPHLTGAENVRLLSGIAGLDPDTAVAFCDHFAELGPYYHRAVQRYSPGMRAQLCFALSMVGRPDMYLADEIVSAGDQRFRDKCEALLQLRLREAGLFVVTKHTRTLERFCTRFYALVEGQLMACESASEASDLVEYALNGSLRRAS